MSSRRKWEWPTRIARSCSEWRSWFSTSSTRAAASSGVSGTTDHHRLRASRSSSGGATSASTAASSPSYSGTKKSRARAHLGAADGDADRVRAAGIELLASVRREGERQTAGAQQRRERDLGGLQRARERRHVHDARIAERRRRRALGGLVGGGVTPLLLLEMRRHLDLEIVEARAVAVGGRIGGGVGVVGGRRGGPPSHRGVQFLLEHQQSILERQILERQRGVRRPEVAAIDQVHVERRHARAQGAEQRLKPLVRG